MKAAVVTEGGLEVREVPKPKPKANEIVVKVRAASLNRADLGVAAGHQHGPIGGAGTVPGLEWAGEVEEVGAEVTSFRTGDRVMCSGSGGYAEYAATDHGRASPVPHGMSFETATTLPVMYEPAAEASNSSGPSSSDASPSRRCGTRLISALPGSDSKNASFSSVAM